MTTDLRAIQAEAARQLWQENFDKAVLAEKERLKTARPWWHAIFPFVITIRKRT
jgi:hypothetical protein